MPLTPVAVPPEAAVALDPGLRGVTVCATTLQRSDGSILPVPANTPCFVRRGSAGRVQIEVCREEPLARHGARHIAPKFAIVDAGTVPEEATRIDTRAAYSQVQAPLFAHAPCPSDVVQGSSRVCALAATVQSMVAQNPRAIVDMLHDHGDGTVSVRLFEARQHTWVPKVYRIEKSVPPPVPRRPVPALWYQLLEKALAVAGWPQHHAVASHSQACPGGYSDQFMSMLTGRAAYARCCDLTHRGYAMSLLLDLLSNGQGLPPPLTQSDAQAVRQITQQHPDIYATLEACGEHQNTIKKVLEINFVPPATLQRLLDCADAVNSGMQRGNAPCSAPELFLGEALQQALQQGKPVCVSTRPSLPDAMEPSRLTRAADILIRLKRPDYGFCVRNGLARAGMLAEHAYAVLAMRQVDGTTQVQLADPSATVGRNYVHVRGVRYAVPTRTSQFWIDLHDLFRYTIGLYFGG